MLEAQDVLVTKKRIDAWCYHDQVLSYGSPPVKYVRAMILGDAIPVR